MVKDLYHGQEVHHQPPSQVCEGSLGGARRAVEAMSREVGGGRRAPFQRVMQGMGGRRRTITHF